MPLVSGYVLRVFPKVGDKPEGIDRSTAVFRQSGMCPFLSFSATLNSFSRACTMFVSCAAVSFLTETKWEVAYPRPDGTRSKFYCAMAAAC